MAFPPAQPSQPPVPPDFFYSKLIGEVFDGEYEDIHMISSIPWLRIKITGMSAEMGACLGEIESMFEGRIWKGFHKNINGYYYLYAGQYQNQENFPMGEVSKFMVGEYGNFGGNWRETEKYTDKIGYFVRVNKYWPQV